MDGDRLCVVRGGGDLATGAIWRLRRAGVRVLVTELAQPLTIRRTVAVSSAITDGSVDVEGMTAEIVHDIHDIESAFRRDVVPVCIAPQLTDLDSHIVFDTVVDARLAKRPLDTTTEDAQLVIALGPGFVVGEHCHAVIETNRGHRLGRVLWTGSAEPNTGTPGVINGRGAERVIHATADGEVRWNTGIGDAVTEGQVLGLITGHGVTFEVRAPFDGMLRGAIHTGTTVRTGLKIADVDPRVDRLACHQISDKALAIGGGVVEAALAGGPP